MGYHATQLVELRGLSAKPEAELQPAPRNRYPQGLRPTEQYRPRSPHKRLWRTVLLVPAVLCARPPGI